MDKRLANLKEAERTFKFANEVEKVHARLFQEALANLEAEELADIFICPICGYTVAGEPPDNCPICNAKKELFRRTDYPADGSKVAW
jgi:rubrerythrin